MNVRVDYFAQVKKAAGTGSETVALTDGALIGDLLKHLASLHGPEFSNLIFGDGGGISSSIMLSINDDQIYPSESPRLSEGNVVAIMTPMSGG